MGIFEEAQRKLREEETARSREEERYRFECDEVALKVTQEFSNYIHVAQELEEANIVRSANKVALTLMGRTLMIACMGEDEFHVIDRREDSGALNQSEMSRRVVGWVDNLPHK